MITLSPICEHPDDDDDCFLALAHITKRSGKAGTLLATKQAAKEEDSFVGRIFMLFVCCATGIAEKEEEQLN